MRNPWKSAPPIEAEYSTVGRQARQRPGFKNTANVEMLRRHFQSTIANYTTKAQNKNINTITAS
jgi:hypothetical protein